MKRTERQILDYIDKNRNECIALLCSLVRIPSENKPPKGDEKACQEYVGKIFESLGLDVDMFSPDDIEGIKNHPGYLKGRDYSDRPNVAGIFKGRKPSKRIMLSAHADVVPVGDESLWTVGPWSGDVIDGKVYGRGACDNKDGIAAMFMALKAILECGIQPDNDIILASVVDEENGGANGSLAALLKYPCNYYINVDGVDLNIVPVSVSGGRFRIDIGTRSDSVCAKDCADALMILYNELKWFEAIKKEEFEKNPFFKDVSFKNNALRILEMKTGNEQDSAENNKGLLKCYVYSTENKETNERQLLQVIDRAYAKMDSSKICKPELKFYRRFFNGARTDPEGPLVSKMVKSYETVTGRKAKVKAGPISDLPLYYEFGQGSCAAMGAGTLTGRGSAHMPDECADIENYIILIKTLALTLLELAYDHG